MKTPLTTTEEPIDRALAAVLHVRKAFGPPGDYGYDSKEGKALFELYEAYNALAAFQDKADAEGHSLHRALGELRTKLAQAEADRDREAAKVDRLERKIAGLVEGLDHIRGELAKFARDANYPVTVAPWIACIDAMIASAKEGTP